MRMPPPLDQSGQALVKARMATRFLCASHARIETGCDSQPRTLWHHPLNEGTVVA